MESRNVPCFEYCALRFLRQWVTRECEHHANLRAKSPTVDSLRAALAYFIVARNFPNITPKPHATEAQQRYADDLARRALRQLLKIRRPSEESAADAVDDLTERLHRIFDRAPCSAASKLLWLRYRDPIVIFDNRAETALWSLVPPDKTAKGASTGSAYADYYDHWQDAYYQHADSIDLAVVQLYGSRLRSVSLHEQRLSSILRANWFRARVFDIYLWEKGKDQSYVEPNSLLYPPETQVSAACVRPR